ncbi:MAG: hypothetical protein ACK559_27205, partial [bacterium]
LRLGEVLDEAHPGLHRLRDLAFLVVVGGRVVQREVGVGGLRELPVEGHVGVGGLDLVLVLLEGDLDDLERGVLVDLVHLLLEAGVAEALLVVEGLGHVLQVAVVLDQGEGVDDQVGRHHRLLGRGVHADDGPEAVGGLLEAVLVVVDEAGLVDHPLRVFVFGVELRELVQRGEL